MSSKLDYECIRKTFPLKFLDPGTESLRKIEEKLEKRLSKHNRELRKHLNLLIRGLAYRSSNLDNIHHLSVRLVQAQEVQPTRCHDPSLL